MPPPPPDLVVDLDDIKVDDRLLQMWRGMPRDMYSLMRHVVGVTTTFMRLTRTVTRYKRVAAHDGHSTRRNVPSTCNDRSQPRTMPDLHEPPVASTISHHGDEARSSADP